MSVNHPNKLRDNLTFCSTRVRSSSALHPCKATEANYTVSVEDFADGRGIFRLTVIGEPQGVLN